ncbi:MAG TPA: sugar kinase [Verrucomicrobiae bacterium]|jgi:2-dehydro-3-deoxygluconokinase|nr:sugar kinase [Verrucomicrobiae bacterium]
MALQLRDAAKSKYDLLALGECMVRLSPPGHGRIEFAKVLEVDVGGGEFNVAYACARLGLRAGFVSKLPENYVARIILNHARAVGLCVGNVVMEKYDGVGRKSRVGLNFTEVGTGVRASVTTYDRGHSSASQMKPEDVDWKNLFREQGARWLHTGGIFTALSETAATTVTTALKAANESGTITSYDLNFRGKLWSSEKAIACTKNIINHVQVLIGNEEDFQKVLGFEVEGADANLRELPIEAYKGMVERVVKAYPHIKAVCTTLREVKSGLINNWGGILWYKGKFYEARPFRDLEIEDRVGGGDGFSSGIAYGFLAGMNPQEIVNFGAAHGALLQTTRGDTSQVTLEEVMHVMQGGSARIQR